MLIEFLLVSFPRNFNFRRVVMLPDFMRLLADRSLEEVARQQNLVFECCRLRWRESSIEQDSGSSRK